MGGRRPCNFPHLRALGRVAAPFLELFKKMNVPRLVDVMMLIAPSLSRSTSATVDPIPERLWINSGTNSAPPGAFGFLTVQYT